MRRSGATPRRNVAVPSGRPSTSCARTCRATPTPSCAASRAGPSGCAATCASMSASAASTTPSAAVRVAGSSQPRSSAAFRLVPASTGAPASATTSANSRPCWRASTLAALRTACPNRLYVSSTRPAPHNGLLSSAARSAVCPKPLVRAATSTVHSTNRRSRSAAISRSRNATSVPTLNGASTHSRQSSASCQRRSITAASTASAPDAPVYACRIVTSASRAGETGGCPLGRSS